jgi:hypothetical protein
MSSCWPREIGDAEVIDRGICSPYHIDKNGKLKPNAYRAPAGSDEVSTMRVDWIGADACKRHAMNLNDPQYDKIYRGLAILSAMQIRHSGAEIIDSREVFKGHSDIKHGIVEKDGDPVPAPQLMMLRTRCKTLATLANYFADPDPASAGWRGPALSVGNPAELPPGGA